MAKEFAMSRLVTNALKRHYLYHGACQAPCTTRTRLAVSCGLLQYLLLRYGCELDSWSASCLEAGVNAMHSRHQKGQQPKWSGLLSLGGRPHAELLGIIATLAMNLAEGKRHAKSEAELMAWVYDHFGGVHDMDALRTEMNNAFSWIAIDAGLRCIGNESGFRLASA
jgi:predicted small metal-binding protein